MRLLLRLENLAAGLAALLAFHLSGGNWWLFAAMILVPDLSFACYLAGPRTGAVGYNLLHSWIGPLLALALGALATNPLWQSIALIWLVHIGIDRAAGYGLKHFAGFKHTHLGTIGGKAG